MQTTLADFIKQTREGEEADAILRSCVHCGFCTATCPTYQLLGDELDGPRGRIYLIKQVLEGKEVTASTQVHLDRCLTCRNKVRIGHMLHTHGKTDTATGGAPADGSSVTNTLCACSAGFMFSTMRCISRYFSVTSSTVRKFSMTL